jgi:hypothetical protein
LKVIEGEKIRYGKKNDFGELAYPGFPSICYSNPIFAYLLRDYKMLHACQERFALRQTYAQRCHCQLLPLNRQHVPAVLAAVGANANDLHSDIHGCDPQC